MDQLIVKPLTCPFAPSRDYFLPQERTKQVSNSRKKTGNRDVSVTSGAGAGEVTCGICGKKFKKGKFLDRHLESHHEVTTDENISTVCIGDYAEILSLAPSFSRYRSIETSAIDEKFDPGLSAIQTGRADGSGTGCSNGDMKRRREKCKKVMNDCFEPSPISANYIDNFCESLHCETTLHKLAGLEKGFHSNSGDFSAKAIGWGWVIGLMLLLGVFYGVAGNVGGWGFLKFWEEEKQSTGGSGRKMD